MVKDAIGRRWQLGTNTKKGQDFLQKALTFFRILVVSFILAEDGLILSRRILISSVIYGSHAVGDISLSDEQNHCRGHR